MPMEILLINCGLHVVFRQICFTFDCKTSDLQHIYLLRLTACRLFGPRRSFRPCPKMLLMMFIPTISKLITYSNLLIRYYLSRVVGVSISRVSISIRIIISVVSVPSSASMNHSSIMNYSTSTMNHSTTAVLISLSIT
jgi:hypothetical protein